MTIAKPAREAPLRLAIVGMGKIARDHHVPSIVSEDRIKLVAIVDRNVPTSPNHPVFENIDGLVASGIGVDAVSICTPPQVRRQLALEAIDAGWHVLLEKPPAASLSEVEILKTAAAHAGVTLFGNWHSRFGADVAAAREWLFDKRIGQVAIIWREDVHQWHPGQSWLWQPGGLGVFDPGVNALSILTYILPKALYVEKATIEVPANRSAPIAAQIVLRDVDGVEITADFDFRQKGRQSWDILIDTDAGRLSLHEGGGRLQLPGEPIKPASSDLEGEYPALYARFAGLVAAGQSDVDVAPLRLVADIFTLARRIEVDPFFDEPDVC